MRPRPSGRGEHLNRGACCNAEDGFQYGPATAFGPWRTQNSVRPTCWLQCGHGLPGRGERNGLKRGHTRRPDRRFNAGHGLRAVENACSARVQPRRPTVSKGFNAATAFGPWRTGLLTASPTSPSPASMRPRPSGRGEHQRPPIATPAAALASMRPRPSGRGEHVNPRKSTVGNPGLVVPFRPVFSGSGLAGS